MQVDLTWGDATAKTTIPPRWFSPPTLRRTIVGLAALLALLMVVWRSLPAFQPAAIDLLAMIELDRDIIAGTWRQDKSGLLISPDEPRALIALTNDVPKAYRLEIEASRKSGGRMVLGLVHESNQYPIELDAAKVGGNPKPDDIEVSDHVAEARRLGFVGGLANTYTCLVRPDGVMIAWEDRIHLMLSPAELKQVANSAWRPQQFSGIFLGTQGSIYEFRRIALQPLALPETD